MIRRLGTATTTVAVLTAVFASAALPAFAKSTSADYTISHQTLDFGGGHSASADYGNVGSVDAIGSASESPVYFVKNGFVGQIHDAPIVTLADADDITRTAGTLHGTVNPNTLATTAQFEYGPTTDFETAVSLGALGNGSVAEALSEPIDALDPGSDYHFRLSASNADGTVQTAGKIFTTVANQPPATSPVVMKRLPDLTAKVLVSELLAAANDPEDDPVAFDSVSATSANGAELFTSGDWVLYSPPEDFNSADSFTYTVEDSFGAVSTGTVTVEMDAGDGDQTLNIRAIDVLPETDGHVHVRFVGVPGRSYLIQATEGLDQAWQTIHTTSADASGLYEFIDEEAGNYTQRFYRAVRE